MPGEHDRVKRRRFRITYRRKGWGPVEFVKVYEAETHGPEGALHGFMSENGLSNDEIVRLEEIEEGKHLQYTKEA
jgi:hypothetical protein